MTARSTAQRDRDRAAIKRERPPCGICGGDIDYALPYLHPMSYVVDHVVPVDKGGEDALPNKQAAHRRPIVQPREEQQTGRGLGTSDLRDSPRLVRRGTVPSHDLRAPLPALAGVSLTRFF